LNVGVVLPVEGEHATRDNVLEAARVADELGFHSVWATDRILKPSAQPSGYPYSKVRGAVAFRADRNWLEPIVVMSMAAAVTRDVMVGTHVLVLPYRQPAVLAQEVASIDWLSGGRVILGVGSGWMNEEFTALGIERSQRGPMTDEAIDLLRTLWTGDAITFDGRFTRMSEMTLGSWTTRVGGPPVYVGGNSAAALERVGLRGDGWLGVDLDPTESARCVSLIESACARQGRSITDLTLSMRRRLEPAAGVAREDAIRSATGGADHLLGQIEAYRRVGIGLVVYDLLMLPDLIESLRWLGSHVLPRVPGRST